MLRKALPRWGASCTRELLQEMRNLLDVVVTTLPKLRAKFWIYEYATGNCLGGFFAGKRKAPITQNISPQQPITTPQSFVMQISPYFNVTWSLRVCSCPSVCFRRTSAILSFCLRVLSEILKYITTQKRCGTFWDRFLCVWASQRWVFTFALGVSCPFTSIFNTVQLCLWRATRLRLITEWKSSLWS